MLYFFLSFIILLHPLSTPLIRLSSSQNSLSVLGIFNISLILRNIEEVVKTFHLVTEYLFDFFFRLPWEWK